MSYEANEHSKECYYEMRNAVIAMQPVASCSDAISRQGLLDTIDRFCDLGKRQLKEIVRDLPPVTPKQRTGHWIETADEYYKSVNEYGGGVDENTPYFTDNIGCSVCLAMFSTIDNETERFNYCHNCGRRMVEPQESEVKG